MDSSFFVLYTSFDVERDGSVNGAAVRWWVVAADAAHGFQNEVVNALYAGALFDADVGELAVRLDIEADARRAAFADAAFAFLYSAGEASL